jgi:hypothetical protein
MPRDRQGLVTVLTTGSTGTMAAAAAILEAAKIPYLEKGGMSRRLGIYLFNASARFVDFQVRSQDADRARELLAHLTKDKD